MMKYTYVDWSAAFERIPSKARRTETNGSVVLSAAFSPDSAGADARINALKVGASLVAPTLVVCRTLGVTVDERISVEVGWAGADCTVILKSKFNFEIH